MRLVRDGLHDWLRLITDRLRERVDGVRVSVDVTVSVGVAEAAVLVQVPVDGEREIDVLTRVEALSDNSVDSVADWDALAVGETCLNNDRVAVQLCVGAHVTERLVVNDALLLCTRDSVEVGDDLHVCDQVDTVALQTRLPEWLRVQDEEEVVQQVVVRDGDEE